MTTTEQEPLTDEQRVLYAETIVAAKDRIEANMRRIEDDFKVIRSAMEADNQPDYELDLIDRLRNALNLLRFDSIRPRLHLWDTYLEARKRGIEDKRHTHTYRQKGDGKKP